EGGETLSRDGARFFGELLKRTGLLPSRVEQALAELAAQGRVTSDSFEGLRALLVPREKRLPFADGQRRRRHKAVTSLEFAGRWSVLRNAGSKVQSPESRVQSPEPKAQGLKSRVQSQERGRES